MANKDPVLKDDSIETVFNDKNARRLPIIWFSLMMLPVVLAMLATILSSGNDDAVPNESPPTSQTSETVQERPAFRPAQPTLLGSSSAVEVSEPTLRSVPQPRRESPPCNFDTFVGRVVNEPILRYFRALDRPVMFLDANKQSNPRKVDLSRILIFVNPQSKTIERIACQ